MLGSRYGEWWVIANMPLVPRLRRALVRFHAVHGRHFPWRETRDPYKVLLAELLLQKTSAGPVVTAWTELVRRYSTVRDMAAIPTRSILSVIRPLGLAKRAKVIHDIALNLVRSNDGNIPSVKERLLRLPGGGPYATAAVLSFAFDQPEPVIDVNAARVYSRVAGFRARTLRQGIAFARVVASAVVTKWNHRRVNYGVLDLSALVCRPVPRCAECPARRFCSWRISGVSHRS